MLSNPSGDHRHHGLHRDHGRGGCHPPPSPVHGGARAHARGVHPSDHRVHDRVLRENRASGLEIKRASITM